MPCLRCLRYLKLFAQTAIVAIGIVGQTNALGVGEKGSFSEIEATIKEEHQIEFARAKYVLHPENPAQMKVLCVKFTKNANGDGYILMSDNMEDSQARIELVYAKMKNTRIYDPRNLGTMPQGVSVQSNLGRALKSAAAAGDSVLMHGESVRKIADGSESIGGSMTVMAHVSPFGNPEKRNSIAILVTTKDDVTSLDKVVAGDLKYTPETRSGP